MMCVFGRLMSQLADVNTQSTVGMFHFYVVLHCCFCQWCSPYISSDSDSDFVVTKSVVACLHTIKYGVEIELDIAKRVLSLKLKLQVDFQLHRRNF